METCRFAVAISCLFVTALFVGGCLKDNVQKTYSYTLYRPVYKTTAAVRANIKSNTPKAIQEPGKLFIKDHFIFLNEVNKGIHVIDNSNPALPKNIAFIDIPGNMDLAVKGNTLYADLYVDFVALDITNPLAVTVSRIIENVFPERYYFNYLSPDPAMVVTDWIIKDTTVTEEYQMANWKKVDGVDGVIMYADSRGGFALNSSVAPATAISTFGKGGSMARFTIVDDRLYAVGTQELNVFDITHTAKPFFVSNKNIGFGIETIFPFKDKLFVGSTNGMFIFNISDPDQPSLVSQFTHVQSCDPVIADGDYAYVTLRSGTVCNGFTNQLEVLNIANLLQPFPVKVYPMTHPSGLSKDGTLLFICDGMDGLKVYDAAKPGNLKLLKTFSGLEPYDVIAFNKLAIVVAKEGLYQFDYSDTSNIKQLSKLAKN